MASARALVAALAVLMFVLPAESTFNNKLLLPDGRRTRHQAMKLRQSDDDPMCAKPPLGIELSASTPDSTPDGTPIIDVSGDDTKFTLTLTVTNPSQRPITFLKRGTPFEGFVSDSFVVTDSDGNRMGYRGVDAKHARIINANEYVVLPPGGSVSQLVTIGGVYELKGNDGRYAVTYTAGIEWTDGELPTSEATQFCHTRVEKIDKGLNKMAALVKVVGAEAYNARQHRRQSRRIADAHSLRDASRRTGSRRWSHAECSADQVSALDLWIKDATQKIDSARSCTECSCAELVDTWFGATTPQSAFALVTEKFDRMRQKMDDSIYNCEADSSSSPVCNGNVYAYVYPTDSSQRIYMCEFTFNYHDYAEKVQTVIHELSHFNTIANTNDNAYGEQTCYDLAQNSPALARTSADNFGYFAIYQNTCYENGPDDYQAAVPPCRWCSAGSGNRVVQDCSTPLPLSDNGTICEDFTLQPTPPPPPCNDNPAGWYDSDGPVYDCDWYVSGDRCASLGDGYENFGTTAKQACCGCGGGVDPTNGTGFDTLPPSPSVNWTVSPSPGGSPTTQPNGSDTGSGSSPGSTDDDCEDVAGWYDSDGASYDCRWYSENNRCVTYGAGYANFGLTARDACCACGGGSNAGSGSGSGSGPQYPSFQPTGFNTSLWRRRRTTISMRRRTSPTSVPSGSGSSSGSGDSGFDTLPPSDSSDGLCTDDPVGWHDSDGPNYHCGWYSGGDSCDRYGNGYANMGRTANEACCACGGGSSTPTNGGDSDTWDASYWLVGGAGQSCSVACAATGCAQEGLDSVAGDLSLQYAAFVQALGVPCDQELNACDPYNCVRWGAPYIHDNHDGVGNTNAVECQAGVAVAACEAVPVDHHHRRLCACYGTSNVGSGLGSGPQYPSFQPTDAAAGGGGTDCPVFSSARTCENNCCSESSCDMCCCDSSGFGPAACCTNGTEVATTGEPSFQPTDAAATTGEPSSQPTDAAATTGGLAPDGVCEQAPNNDNEGNEICHRFVDAQGRQCECPGLDPNTDEHHCDHDCRAAGTNVTELGPQYPSVQPTELETSPPFSPSPGLCGCHPLPSDPSFPYGAVNSPPIYPWESDTEWKEQGSGCCWLGSACTPTCQGPACQPHCPDPLPAPLPAPITTSPTQFHIASCSSLNTVFEDHFDCCGSPHKPIARSIANGANNATYNVAKCKDLKAIYRKHNCCQQNDTALDMTLL